MKSIDKLRPVRVKGKRGFFHCWGDFGDTDGNSVMGVIEFEDGSCDYYLPYEICFLDREKAAAE